MWRSEGESEREREGGVGFPSACQSGNNWRGSGLVVFSGSACCWGWKRKKKKTEKNLGKFISQPPFPSLFLLFLLFLLLFLFLFLLSFFFPTLSSGCISNNTFLFRTSLYLASQSEKKKTKQRSWTTDTVNLGVVKKPHPPTHPLFHPLYHIPWSYYLMIPSHPIFCCWSLWTTTTKPNFITSTSWLSQFLCLLSPLSAASRRFIFDFRFLHSPPFPYRIDGEQVLSSSLCVRKSDFPQQQTIINTPPGKPCEKTTFFLLFLFLFFCLTTKLVIWVMWSGINGPQKWARGWWGC